MAFLSTNTLFSFPITHLAIVLRDPGNILLRYPLLSDKIIWLVALAAKYYMYIVTAGGGGGVSEPNKGYIPRQSLLLSYHQTWESDAGVVQPTEMGMHQNKKEGRTGSRTQVMRKYCRYQNLMCYRYTTQPLWGVVVHSD